jgi:MFS family permease
VTGPESNENNSLLLKLPKWKIWYVMGVLYFLWFLDFATRTVISPMFPAIQKELSLTDSQLGMLTSIVLAMITVLALPLSYVIDRWRRGKLVSLMGIVWSIGSLFSGLSSSFGQLLASRGVLGVGESAYASGGMAMISATIKKERRATVTGLWNTAIPLGIAFGMIAGGWIAVTWGWRMAFIVLAVPGLILGILAWFFPDYKSNTVHNNGQNSPGFISTIKELVKNKALVYLYVSFALYTLYSQACVYWGPTLFTRYFNMDMASAGMLSGSMTLLALIAGPLGGILADRIARKNPRNKIMLCFVSIFLTLAFNIVGFVWQIIPLLFAGSFFSVLFLAAQMTSTQEIVPAYQRASSYGVYVVCQYLLGGLWGPWVTGIISDASNLLNAFTIVTIIGLVGCMGYLLAARYFNGAVNTARAKDLEMEKQAA